jgi:hypothetical protein
MGGGTAVPEMQQGTTEAGVVAAAKTSQDAGVVETRHA